MRGSKPGERRGGRQKGSRNKLGVTIKEALEGAFNQVGGQAYLAKMAADEPKAFMALLGKAMPQQLDANITTQPAFTVHDFIVPPEAQ